MLIGAASDPALFDAPRRCRLAAVDVHSEDGTRIAFTREGDGPRVILVGGGATDRAENAPLARALARWFAAVNYDRRGRGESADTPPYALARELEDLDALLAGGRAHVVGISSGGALALEAAAAGLAIDRVVVYEVPYNVEPGWPARWRAYVDELRDLLAAGRRGDAFAHFMRLAEVSEHEIAAAREAPFWPQLEALAPTLAYDAACLGNGAVPARFGAISQPVLVLTGERDGPAWVRALGPAADALAATLPNGERQTLPHAEHVADPIALGEVVRRFLAAV
jgi:pimeloyl-ACP methyl ester carboxylesterase